MNNVIILNNFNYKELFYNLDISVQENNFITISGPNNCGKTTLIRILSRVIQTNEKIEIYNQNINEYKIDKYLNFVQTVIPEEIIFKEDNLEDELYYQQTSTDKERREFISFISSGLKIKKVLTKKITTLTKKEMVLSQIAVALCHKPKILLIDNISTYFDKKELKIIFSFLNEFRNRYGLTLIQTTLNLDISMMTDYLYIINEGKIALEGTPLDILQKDNIINKIGLEVPFMIDLSVKLRDYDLVDNIETNLDRMVDKLWN